MNRQTKGVETLLGNPKKAMVKLSIPIMLAMLIQTFYNVIDGIWVAGLGADHLAAIGMFFPIYMIILSLAIGIGVGGSAAISRKIGAKDHEGADSAAMHTMLVGMLVLLLVLFLVFPFLEPIFQLIGVSDNVLQLTLSYGRILVGGSFLLIFNSLSSGVLRGEGDPKRAMWAMVLGSVLNMALDPLFIFTFKMGIVGAAWATLVSMFISSLLLFYWLFIKRVSFVVFHFFKFRFDKQLMGQILRVGIPVSLSQMSMSVAIFMLNYIVVFISNSDGVAVFTGAWRILMIGLVPVMGIQSSMISITGAAYGAKNVDKLETAYHFGMKLGVLIELAIVGLIFLFANPLAYLFSYSKGSVHIQEDLVLALRSLEWFLLLMPLGMLTAGMFQGIGKGENALLINLFRTLVFQLLFSYLLAIVFKNGLQGVYWGVVSGNLLAAVLAFGWGHHTVKKLRLKFEKTKK